MGLRRVLEKPRTERAVRATRLLHLPFSSRGQFEHRANAGSAAIGGAVEVARPVLGQTGEGKYSVGSPSEGVEYLALLGMTVILSVAKCRSLLEDLAVIGTKDLLFFAPSEESDD